MAHPVRPAVRIAAVCGFLLPALVAAQGERVTLRFSPKPEQVLHTKTTMRMSLVPDAAGNGPSVETTITTGYTMSFGKQDEQGRFDGDMVIDQMTTEGTVNGQPIPTPNVQMPMVGQRFGVTYDGSGNIVDVRPPADPALGDRAPQMQQMIRQMMGQINRLIPIGQTIGVGETVKKPLDFEMPAPPGAPPASLHMTMAMTLKSIDSDGPYRIAKFDQVLTLSATGGPGSRAQMDMQGTGTLEWNLDRGFARTATGDFTMSAQTARGPREIKMKMTMTTTE